MPRLFCFGLGYTARRLAAALRDDGWQIAGTCRSAEKSAALTAEGVEAWRFGDGSDPLDAAALEATTHLLVSIPPDPTGDPVLAAHAADIAGLAGLRWAGYLSTTGVYGDHAGAWVDEATPCRPGMDRTLRRFAAEQAWLALVRDSGVPVHIFRLAGIYGPGRSVLDQVRAGTARRLAKPGHVFSRIHVDDIVAVLRASMARPDPGAIYNVCDDEPASNSDVVAFACTLLGSPPPPEIPVEQAALSPMARSFYAENRRVSNERIRRELGVTLRYPDFRTGLAAIVEAERRG